MLRIQYSIISITLALAAFQTTFAAAGEHWIEGKVTDGKGKLLPGVLLLCDRATPPVTGPDGRYLMDLGSSLTVTFHLKGFKPQTKIVPAARRIVDARLERDAGHLWKIPPCSPSAPMKSSLVQYFLFPAASGKKSQRSFDVDFGVKKYVYKIDTQIYVLAMLHGGFCCRGVPSSELYVNARTYHQRSFETPQFSGLDASGVDLQGLHWRYVGPDGGFAVEYRNMPKLAATYFDRIIDSMCFQGGPIPNPKP